MKRCAARLCCVLVFAATISNATAQVEPNQLSSKPVPTLAQCRADRDAWSKIDPIDDHKSQLTADDLVQMSIEMSQCGFSIDRVNNAKYMEVFRNLNLCLTGRYYDFINRHDGMWSAFEKEDKSGAR